MIVLIFTGYNSLIFNRLFVQTIGAGKGDLSTIEKEMGVSLIQ
jgi:hypothetical protein